MRAVWVFLLWRADYVNGLVGLFGCSRVGCQVLPGAEAANYWLWGLIMRQLTAETWRPKASAILLMGRVRIQENLGLLSTYWWMKPDPGAWLLVPEQMSDFWWLGLVPNTADSGGWCLEACIGLLVGGDQAQPVPGQAWSTDCGGIGFFV